MDRQRLAAWIGRQTELSKIVVRHYNSMGKADGDIASIAIPEQGAEPDAIAGEILKSAEDDASGIGGVQTYSVLGFADEKQKVRLTFRVEGEDDDVEKDGISTEPATKTGLLAQLMRHNEALQRALCLSNDSTLRAMSKALAQATAQNEHMQAKHFETVETVEGLLSMKDERDLKRQESEQRSAALGEMIGTVKMLAPAIAKRVLGKNGDPIAAPNTQQAGIEALRDSLMKDPERMNSIFEKLTETEKAVLIEMMTPAN